MKRDLTNWNPLSNIPCKEASSFLFAIAVGDDGVPGIGMPALISFINLGEGIANSAEQFLLFAADVDKNSGIVTIFFDLFEFFLVCDLDLVAVQEILLKRRFFDYQIAIKSYL